MNQIRNAQVGTENETSGRLELINEIRAEQAQTSQLKRGQVAGQPYPRWKVYDAPIIAGSIDTDKTVYLEIGVDESNTQVVVCRNESEPWFRLCIALLRRYRLGLEPLIATLSGDLRGDPFVVDRITIIGKRQAGAANTRWDYAEVGPVTYNRGFVTLESGTKVRVTEPFFPNGIRSALGGFMTLTMERRDTGSDVLAIMTADVRSIAGPVD